MLHITHSLSSIFISRCRHATISQFFGNQKPDCAGACDFCRDPGLVRAQLARAAALSTRTGPAQSAGPRGPFGFDPELYAGGRKGYGFERSADLLLKQLCCMIRAVSLWRLRACVCVCVQMWWGMGRWGRWHSEEKERFRRSLQETDEVEKGEHTDRALTSRRTNGESHENISRSLFYQKCYVSPFPPLNKINKKCKVIVTFNLPILINYSQNCGI